MIRDVRAVHGKVVCTLALLFLMTMAATFTEGSVLRGHEQRSHHKLRRMHRSQTGEGPTRMWDAAYRTKRWNACATSGCDGDKILHGCAIAYMCKHENGVRAAASCSPDALVTTFCTAIGVDGCILFESGGGKFGAICPPRAGLTVQNAIVLATLEAAQAPVVKPDVVPVDKPVVTPVVKPEDKAVVINPVVDLDNDENVPKQVPVEDLEEPEQDPSVVKPFVPFAGIHGTGFGGKLPMYHYRGLGMAMGMGLGIGMNPFYYNLLHSSTQSGACAPGKIPLQCVVDPPPMKSWDKTFPISSLTIPSTCKGNVLGFRVTNKNGNTKVIGVQFVGTYNVADFDRTAQRHTEIGLYMGKVTIKYTWGSHCLRVLGKDEERLSTWETKLTLHSPASGSSGKWQEKPAHSFVRRLVAYLPYQKDLPEYISGTATWWDEHDLVQCEHPSAADAGEIDERDRPVEDDDDYGSDDESDDDWATSHEVAQDEPVDDDEPEEEGHAEKVAVDEQEVQEPEEREYAFRYPGFNDDEDGGMGAP